MANAALDPHKGTHTAVAIDNREQVLTERLVRATHRQVPELVAWADQLGTDDRIWAVESAGGLGYLLAQQLLAAGETVVDIPATLASRVRLLGSGRSDKNDSNDARSVAIAALRAPSLVPVRVEDHATVLRLLSRRHTQLAWAQNKTACRLHALVADLVPGGISTEVVVSQALALLEDVTPAGAAAVERHRLALELVDDLDRLEAQRKASKARIRTAVAASGTTLTNIFGVSDVVAATLIGHTGDIGRFPTADRFAAYNGTAPIEWSSGNPKRPTHRLSRRGNRAMNHALHIAARSPSSVTPTARAEPSMTANSARATPPKKPSGPSSDGSAPSSTGTYSSTPPDAVERVREGIQETTPQACVTGPTS